MLAVAIALFIDRRAFAAMAEEFLQSRALLYLSGFLTMPAGIAIILTHNVWVAELARRHHRARLADGDRRRDPHRLSGRTQAWGRGFLRHRSGRTIAGAIWLAFGAVLTFYGYFR